ncbi:MAG: class I SAM-dependent methyltransferase [Pseudomonadota bacterium]
MTDETKFWDKMAERYFAKPISNPEVYEEKLRLTQALMHPDMEVFELGCGTGGTAIRHSGFVKHIRATDVSEAMLTIARRQAEEAGVQNVVFERIEISGHDEAPDTYDMVLGLSILHLLRNPEDIMRRIYRWLKPGGYFVSSTACLGDKMPWFRFVGPIGRAIGIMPYVNVFKAEKLIADFNEAGFAIATNWRPDGGLGVFVIAQKPAESP